jgi:hypothetical protein
MCGFSVSKWLKKITVLAEPPEKAIDNHSISCFPAALSSNFIFSVHSNKAPDKYLVESQVSLPHYTKEKRLRMLFLHQ